MAESWQLLHINKRTGGNNPAIGLTRNTDAIQALADIRKSPAFEPLGLSDEVLASLNGYKTGTLSASYADVLNDLNKFGQFVHQNPNTTIDNLIK